MACFLPCPERAIIQPYLDDSKRRYVCLAQRLTIYKKYPTVHIMKILDKIPLGPLVLVAIALGLAPFVPEPHLWEKLKMLFAGTLVRPIDIFDLFMHGTPAVLVVLKLVRMKQVGSSTS